MAARHPLPLFSWVPSTAHSSRAGEEHIPIDPWQSSQAPPAQENLISQGVN